MKTRVKVDLRLVALIVALVALFLALLQARPPRAEEYWVPVAAHALYPGQVLYQDDVAVRPFPVQLPGALPVAQDALGRRLLVSLAPGQPIFQSELGTTAPPAVLVTLPATAPGAAGQRAEVLLLPTNGAPRTLLRTAPIVQGSAGIPPTVTILVPTTLAPALVAARQGQSLLALPEP